MITEADRDDLIWLAGLCEGEACFDLHKGRYPRVRISMCDRDVVGRAATLFGSTIRLTLKQAPDSPIWSAEKQGAAAVEIMQAILPWMGTRRSQRIASILSAYRMREASPTAAYGRSLARPPGLLSPSGDRKSGAA